MLRGRRQFAGALRLLLIFLAALPFVPSLFVASSASSPWLVHWLERGFALQCRREPTRVIWGALVCARCLGIYLGLGLGALIVKPRMRPAIARVWVGFAGLLMLLDVLSEALLMRPPVAGLRLITGALLSYPVAVFLLHATSGTRNAEHAPRERG